MSLGDVLDEELKLADRRRRRFRQMGEQRSESEHADRLLDADDNSDGGDEPSQESAAEDNVEEAQTEQAEAESDDPDLEDSRRVRGQLEAHIKGR